MSPGRIIHIVKYMGCTYRGTRPHYKYEADWGLLASMEAVVRDQIHVAHRRLYSFLYISSPPFCNQTDMRHIYLGMPHIVLLVLLEIEHETR